MKQYKYLEHTADVEFVAFGRNLEECFKNALMAMFDTMCYTKKLVASKSKKSEFNIKDKAKNADALLWYALQDTLSFADSKGLFCYKIKSIKIRESKKGFEMNFGVLAKERENKTSKLDVKGVPRYNLGIKRTKKGFEATVVLDV